MPGRYEGILQESEKMKLMEFCIDSMGEAVFWVTIDGHIWNVNTAACEMLGYSREELLSLSLHDIDHEYACEDTQSDLEELKRTGSLQLKRCLSTRDDRIIPVEITAKSFIYIGDGYFCYIVRDIAERKRVEDELDWKSTFMKAQVDSSPDGILVVDERGEKLLQNRLFVDLWQIPEEIAAQNSDAMTLQFVSSRTKDPKRFIDKVVSIYDHPAETIRDNVELKDGRVFDRYSSPVLDRNGKYYGRIWTFRDVTRQLNAGKLLRESEEKFRVLSETSPIPIIVYQEENAVYANPAAGRLFGYSRRDLAKKKLWEWVHEDFRDEVRNRILARQRGENIPTQHEAKFVTKGGEERWGLVSAGFIKFQGAPAGIATVIDITERKRAEEELLLATFCINHASIGVYQISEKGNIRTVNEYACQSLGYTMEELCSMSVFDIDPTFYGEVFIEHRRKLSEAGSRTFETIHRRKDGSTFPVEVTVNLLEFRGRKFILSFARDISERKRAEEERNVYLRFLQSMDRVNRAIQGTNDLEQMMSNVLDIMLSIFNCDRVFLGYPCDPDSAAWKIAMERTRPDYPGQSVLGQEHPMTPSIAEASRIMLVSNGPVQYGPETGHPLPDSAEQYGFKSVMMMALHPKGGKPWVFGIHQCSYARVWTLHEENLFKEIGRQLEDGLASLLVHRDLRESEARLKMAMDLAKLVQWEYDFKTDMFTFDDQFYALYGTTPEREGGTLMSAKDYAHKFIPCEESSVVARGIAEVVANSSSQLEHRIIRDDGEERFIVVRAEAVRDQTGCVLKIRGANQDITKRKRMESVLMAPIRLLRFAATHTLEELLVATLDEAEALTGSQIGFYHLLEADQKTLSLQNWSSRTKSQFCADAVNRLHYDISSAGVWVDCIRERRPVIHNDYASLPHRKGLPPGHGHLVRELVLPVFRDNCIAAIIGVGNKPQDYTSDDVEVISFLADLSWEIAEFKQAEEALHVSRFCIDKAAVGIFLIDENAAIADVNDAACKRLGYTKDELCVMNVFDIDPVITHERMLDLQKIALATGSVTHESIHRRKDGTTFPVEVTSNPLVFQGKSYRISYVMDITRRKEAEEELKKKNQLLETLFSSISDFVFVKDTKRRFVLANREFLDIMDLSEHQVLGKTGEEIDRTCLKMLNDSNEQTVLERGLTCREELTLNKAGATRCFDSIMVPLKEENGVIAGLVVMGRDISTRKEIEASLLESQNVLELRSKELEETNSALRIILRQSEANKKEMEEQMSSNIRQLVMPYLQLLKKEIKANDNMAYLNIIETNLREICSSFSAKLSHRYAELSPKEILVANLVKEGRQDKSIAEALYLSVGTIKAHRRNIRKKLGIAGKKTNLRVFLSPLENE